LPFSFCEPERPEIEAGPARKREPVQFTNVFRANASARTAFSPIERSSDDGQPTPSSLTISADRMELSPSILRVLLTLLNSTSAFQTTNISPDIVSDCQVDEGNDKTARYGPSLSPCGLASESDGSDSDAAENTKPPPPSQTQSHMMSTFGTTVISKSFRPFHPHGRARASWGAAATSRRCRRSGATRARAGPFASRLLPSGQFPFTTASCMSFPSKSCRDQPAQRPDGCDSAHLGGVPERGVRG
jgi:hypothetical protein